MPVFSNTSGASSPMDLIPPGALLWCLLTFRGMKDSNSGGSYADLELAVADKQPFARKKLWEMCGDPDHRGNSEAYRAMGMTSLTRMMESAGLVNPEDPNSYERFNGMSTEQVFMALDGKYVAVRVKIEKGGDGYEDKNKVGDYLTPNKNSSSYKNFVKLTTGDHGVTKSPVGQAHGASGGTGGGFGGGNGQQGNAQQGNGGGQGGFGGQQRQEPQQGQQGQSDRPLDRQETSTTRPSEPQRGFNPNGAGPAFLNNNQ